MGNKIYYNCPGCDRRVWAYSGFVGNRCWDCPGTILHGIAKATPGVNLITSGIEAAADVKIHYDCPNCGKNVWAYGNFSGQECWNCKMKNPLKGVVDGVTLSKRLIP